MDETAKLRLPYILAAQSQKHVTHNEGLRRLDALVQLSVEDRDLSAPPAVPGDGDRYIVAASPSGAWAGHASEIAAWQDGAWEFYAPGEGWLAWVADEDILVAWDGSAWAATGGGGGGGSLNPATGGLVGINDTADSTNRLKVRSPAVLFDREVDDVQLKLSKAASADTASLLFQTNYAGRAEMGLAGDDDFHFKVSPDGSTFHEAMLIDKNTGAVSFPNTTLAAGAAPNLLVNGDFQVNQRNFAGGALSAGVFGFDRWKAATGGANGSLSGYTLTLTSGELEQVVEPGLWGYASFASLQVTVSVGTPSQNLTVTFGSQSGTITAGSGRRSVTLTLGAGDTGNRSFKIKRAAAGSVTFSRVKIEVGASATGWQARTAADELRLCQRYYFIRRKTQDYDVLFMVSFYTTTASWGGTMKLPVTMRAAPTVAFSAAADFSLFVEDAAACSSINGWVATTEYSFITTDATLSSGSVTAGAAGMFYFTNANSGWVSFTAEL